MKTTTYPSVWDAISDTPQETASMKARSNLMDMASTAGMSPEVPVTQPRAKPVAARRKRPVSAA